MTPFEEAAKQAENLIKWRDRALREAVSRIMRLFDDNPVEDQTAFQEGREKGLSEAVKAIEAGMAFPEVVNTAKPSKPDCDMALTFKEVCELNEWAWSIIANAGGGDWHNETLAWRAGAVKWRDRFHALLDRTRKKADGSAPDPAPDQE